jgi:hypothetical protein
MTWETWGRLENFSLYLPHSVIHTVDPAPGRARRAANRLQDDDWFYLCAGGRIV